MEATDFDEGVIIKASEWLEWDKNRKTREEIDALVVSGNIKELRARMNEKLAFGTAGIRQRMEAGFGRLNELTIIQVTQGFAAYLQQQYSDGPELKEKGVVIGYDTRHNSKQFAELAAHVFVLQGIRVHFFADTYVPTPLVPFAIIKLGALAGIMITASHNPKDDNGYKAYWRNGAQIMPPHDKNIIAQSQTHRVPMNDVWHTSWLAKHELCINLCAQQPSVIDQYFTDELDKFCHRKSLNEKCPLKFVYTPVHGVGARYTPRALQRFGFSSENIFYDEKQKEPDPDFTTAPFPNPEEGEKVLKTSLAAADALDCPYVLANDPDADRFQIAEKQADGQWSILHGNEMGSLLAWYIWLCLKEASPHLDRWSKFATSKYYFINSTVSTRFVATMAAAEGFNYEETLTGFKYMGNRAEELRSNGYIVPLAWEESIGYMPGTSLDKDGVLTAAVFAELCAYLHSQNRRLSDQLFELYNRYGYHLTCGGYFICNDGSKMKSIFDVVRYGVSVGGKQLAYPKMIHGERVVGVRDLTIGYDNTKPDNKPTLPVNASSQMITFTLESGSIVTIRGSGTEPKLKYYVELITEPGKSKNDVDAVQAALQELTESAIALLIRPDETGLQRR